MPQPPALGPGPGADPGRDPGLADSTGPGTFGVPGVQPGRPPALADFATGGACDACPPGPGLAVAVAGLSGPDWRCPGATDEELLGLLNRWAAVESWAAAGKLGVARELLRRRGTAVPQPRYGDLPEIWDEGAGHEVSGALAVSLPGADKLLNLAWTLRARLPRIGALLAAGTIDALKAGIIVTEFLVLDDEKAAAAEALIADQLAGKTPSQSAGWPSARSSRWTPRARRSGGSGPSGTMHGCGCGERTPGPARWPRTGCPPTRRWPRTPTSTLVRWRTRRRR